MAEPIGPTLAQTLPRKQIDPGFKEEDIPTPIAPVEDVRGGMVVGFPRSKIPQNSFRRIENGRIRYEGIIRREGTLERLAKPNSTPVLSIILFYDESRRYSIVRFDEDSIYIDAGHGSWEEVVSEEDEMANESGRVVVAQIPWGGEDFLFFANGIGPIRYIQLIGGKTYHIWADSVGVGARFITSFAERLVWARGIEIGRSANGLPLDFDDISAGTDFMLADGGFSNPITGLFGLVNECIMLRERSIWHISRNALSTAPFRYTLVIKDQGCDMPHTAVQAGNAVIFADYRTSGVYIYQPGSQPVRISEQIDVELFEDLQNLKWAQGAWNPVKQEYHLGLAVDSDSEWITKRWVWSMKHKAWCLDDTPEYSAMGVIILPDSRVTIDELIGTIDGLTGTIDELGGSGELSAPAMMYGTETGEVVLEHPSYDTDWDGSAFELLIESQNLGSFNNRRTLMEVSFKCTNTRDGEARIDNSPNGETWRNLRTYGEIDSATKKLRNVNQVTGDDLFFRFRSNTGNVNISGYWVRMQEKAKQF